MWLRIVWKSLNSLFGPHVKLFQKHTVPKPYKKGHPQKAQLEVSKWCRCEVNLIFRQCIIQNCKLCPFCIQQYRAWSGWWKICGRIATLFCKHKFGLVDYFMLLIGNTESLEDKLSLVYPYCRTIKSKDGSYMSLFFIHRYWFSFYSPL